MDAYSRHCNYANPTTQKGQFTTCLMRYFWSLMHSVVSAIMRDGKTRRAMTLGIYNIVGKHITVKLIKTCHVSYSRSAMRTDVFVELQCSTMPFGPTANTLAKIDCYDQIARGISFGEPPGFIECV